MVPKGAVDVVGLEDCRQCFEHASILVQCLATDGTVLQANQALLDLLGYTHADYIGLHVSEVHADPEVVADILTALANRESLTDYATRLRCGDGSIREVLISLNAYWKGDRFVHTHSFIRDVTQEHRSETIYSKVFRISPDSMAISVLDDGRILDVNDACLRMTGLQRQDMIGKMSVELGMWLRPEDRKEYVGLLRRDGSVRDSKVSIRVKGEIRDVLLSSEVVEFQGKQCVLGVARDLTAQERTESQLRASEARFRAFAESSRATMTLSDEHRFIYVNPRAEEVTGYTQAELLTMNFAHLLRPDMRPAMVEQAQARLRGEDVSRHYAFPIIRKDGETRWLDVAVTVIEIDGRPCSLATGIDITERKEAEAALHASETELRQAQKMEVVGRLAGGVAHDFNNLLSIVVGHSAILMSGLAAQDPLRTHVAAISRAADRATSLTQQLLAFSRRDIVRPRVLSLNDTVSQVEQLLPRLIGESIRVVITLDPALANIRADPNQVEHVLMNLAGNARDAMPQGGTLYLATASTVFDAAAVRAHPGAQPGPYVTVSVRDTGQGMDTAAAAQVFEPFYTTKARGKGTGLGLATVYGIVKQAGGYIDLETASGRGSTFTVYFPQVDAVEDPIESAPSATGPVTGTETVLVVEDEDEVRALFSEGLTALGYTVLTACDGPSALEICGEDVSIDVVLTDVVMPGMSGSELSKRLSERYPGLKILFMSGYADDILEPQGLVGVEAHLLRKPCTPDDAARLIRHVLEDTVGSSSWADILGARPLRRDL